MRALLYVVLTALPLLFSVPVQAARPNPAEQNVAVPSVPTARAAVERQALADASQTEAMGENRLAEAERRTLILEARSEVENAAYARLEILIGVFGALITVLVVGFGIATYRSAANAARAELANIKERVKALQEEAEVATAKAVLAATSADQSAGSAEAAAKGALAHQQVAEEASEKIRAAAALATEQLTARSGMEKPAELSASERQTVSDAARELTHKPERDWTGDDFRVKILETYDRKDWSEMLRLARGMEFLHESDPSLLAFALIQKAWALEKLGQVERSIAAYEEAIRRLEAIETPSVQDAVAMALLNKALLLSSLNKWDDSFKITLEVIERFSDAERIVPRKQVAKAKVLKANLFRHLDKNEQAIVMYQEIIKSHESDGTGVIADQIALARLNMAFGYVVMGKINQAIDEFNKLISDFSDHEDADIGSYVNEAIFGRAGLFARQKKIRASIASLDTWKARNGSFDCAKVVEDSNFDYVRTRPSFLRYMTEQGCLT